MTMQVEAYRSTVSSPEKRSARALAEALRAEERKLGAHPRAELMRRQVTAEALTASAQRLTATRDQSNDHARGSARKVAEWQEEAWEMRDLIGEQRFLGDTLAGRMGQAALYVGKIDPQAPPGQRPKMDENPVHQAILDAIGDGPAGLSQLLTRCGVNLFVAGEAWLVGIPPRFIKGTAEYEERQSQRNAFGLPTIDRGDESQTVAADDLMRYTWRIFSVSEIEADRENNVSVELDDGEKVKANINELYAIRIWRPHPRRAWEADSPTRASLPVLRELLGLTMHVSAQIDSRLAGAGILFISNKADVATKEAAGMPINSPDSPVTQALVTAAQTAIKDRSSASALVPIVITVPDDVVDNHKFVTFSTPLDKEARALRDEAIRRLALGQDAPPELLLGVAGMNHWGAWLVREDVVKTHLEPPLALICDAITTQYLRPVLRATGMSEEEAAQYVVWYDVDELITRPNRGADAKELFQLGILSDTSTREANGFTDEDAPKATVQADPALDVAFAAIAKNPSLMADPGLPRLVQQIRDVLAGSESTKRAAEADKTTDKQPNVKVIKGKPAEGPPSTSPSAAPSGTPADGGGA